MTQEQMMKVTATFVRRLEGWRGDARLYELSEPITYFGGKGGHTRWVVISAVDTPVMYEGGSPSETYIFPAREDGTTLDMGELEGSFQGAKDHSRAIRGAGWEET